jgi:hypothetical protein
MRRELKQWAHERLFSGPITHLEEYREDVVRGLWERHQAGLVDLSRPLWRWISLGEWLALFDNRVWRNGI